MKIKLLILTTILAHSVYAQDTSQVQKEAMQKLRSLVGHWEGSGWIRQGETTSTFNQTEDVLFKLDNTTLLIEGRGYHNDSLVFQAMAVASFDPKQQKYLFNSYLADGKYVAASGWFEDVGVFHWEFETPSGGMVRYSVELTESTWNEKGAFSPANSEEWYPFMAMNLKKSN